jgi:predicted AAA+ superfamily ATPase
MTYVVDRILTARIARGRASVLLLGPRQVGKTTLCRSMSPTLTIDLADEGEYLRLARDPGALRAELRALPRGGVVHIDEVQRVPALLNVVQAALEDHGGLRFLLTGSSARKLRRKGANLLPGRVVVEHLDPLTSVEMGDRFDLDRALRMGMLPRFAIDADAEAEALLASYAAVYLREEIRAEAVTRNVGGFARFLDVIAAMSGRWLNYSKAASDAEMPKETVRRFVEILEDTLVAHRLPPFEPRRATTRRLAQRDRILLFDVGVRNALLGRQRVPPSLDEVGPLFEHWLILELLHVGRALGKQWRLSSYRTESGAEVDLVIERARDVVGIEIKHGRALRGQDLRGLHSLGEVAGPRLIKLVAFRGPRPQKLEGGVEALPYRELIRRLADEP